MLLDLAARVQDLLQFRFDSFTLDKEGGGVFCWIMKKTSSERIGYLTPETMCILE
jgi:hypothetical protein